MLWLTALVIQISSAMDNYPPNIQQILLAGNLEKKRLILKVIQSDTKSMLKSVSQNIDNSELILIVVSILEKRDKLEHLFKFILQNGPNVGPKIIPILPSHIQQSFTSYFLANQDNLRSKTKSKEPQDYDADDENSDEPQKKKKRNRQGDGKNFIDVYSIDIEFMPGPSHSRRRFV